MAVRVTGHVDASRPINRDGRASIGESARIVVTGGPDPVPGRIQFDGDDIATEAGLVAITAARQVSVPRGVNRKGAGLVDDITGAIVTRRPRQTHLRPGSTRRKKDQNTQPHARKSAQMPFNN